MSQKNTQQKKLSVTGKISIALFLLALASLTHYMITNVWQFNSNRETSIEDTQKGVDYDFSSSASFYSYDARFFYFCTKDGMKYVSSNGDVRWQEMYNLPKPIMDGNGTWVAVGEEKGKRVYVFDPDGQAYNVTFDNPVLTFSVNQAGYLAVVLQLDKGYAVHIYNKSNSIEPLYSNVIHDLTVTPTAVSVSEDGKYAAIALLDYSIRLSSQVMFCYVNAYDSWDITDGVFAVMNGEYENQIVHTIRFMADSQVLVFTDTQIVCYKPGESHSMSEQWVIPLHNKIFPIAFYGLNSFSFVTGDMFLNDEDAAEPGEVNIYSISGELTGTFRLGRKATYLSMGHNHVIAGADRSFYVLDNRGTRIWDHQTIHDTRHFIFLDNTDTVLIAGGTRASVWKRVRVKADSNDIVSVTD